MPGTGTIGFLYRTFTGNSAGAQLGVCGAGPASAASAKTIQGILHSLSWGVDSAQWQVVVYDGTDTTGTVVAKVTGPAAAGGSPGSVILDVQANVGLFVVITSTGTSAGLTFAFC
jgi:hypothetical protein